MNESRLIQESRREPSTFSRLRDYPIAKREDDCLGFVKLSESLAQRIKTFHNADGDVRGTDYHSIDTFGIFGSWGTGKSSVLALTKDQCFESVIWIDFDALKYQTDQMILVPLMHRIAEECGDQKAGRLFWRMVKSLGEFAADVIVATSGVSVKEPLLKLSKSIQANVEQESASKDELPESRARAIERAFAGLVQLLRNKRKQERVVIAIDNLDRCRPAALLELLEAIHLLLETNNVTFILAMDQDACLRSIEKQHGFKVSEAALYLEKMVPDYFRIPNLWKGKLIAEEKQNKKKSTEYSILFYLRRLFADRHCKPLIAHEKMIWEVISSTTILRNPRRIKRLLRRMASFSSDWWARHQDDSLATLFLCAVSDIWPSLYSALPVTEPTYWTDFISHAEKDQQSGDWLDELVDPPFLEFIMALSQWDKPRNATGFSTIRQYNELDELLDDMQVNIGERA